MGSEMCIRDSKERAYGRDHPDVATTLTNLGDAYRALGDSSKARDMLERALAIDERAYGRDHVQVAFSLGSLGLAYGALGDAAKKCEYVTRTVKIFEGAYGPGPPHAKWYRAQLESM